MNPANPLNPDLPRISPQKMSIRFTNPNDPDGTQLKATLQRLVWEAVPAWQGAAMVWEEHECKDDACLHAQTTLRVTTPGGAVWETGFYKPLVFIRKGDIATALRGAATATPE